MTRGTTWTLTAVAAVMLAVGGASPLQAQERADGDWWRWALAEVLAGQEVRTAHGRRVRIDPDRFHRERDRDFGRRRGHGGSPSFCRSGRGHPVFSRQWCVRKGFGLGRARWRRVDDLGDILFRDTSRRDGTILDRSGLGEILGDIILGRLLGASDLDRRRTHLTGRWLEDGGVRVLQIRSGERPVAELSDMDHDGVVDVLLRAVEED